MKKRFVRLTLVVASSLLLVAALTTQADAAVTWRGKLGVSASGNTAYVGQLLQVGATTTTVTVTLVGCGGKVLSHLGAVVSPNGYYDFLFKTDPRLLGPNAYLHVGNSGGASFNEHVGRTVFHCAAVANTTRGSQAISYRPGTPCGDLETWYPTVILPTGTKPAGCRPFA